MNNWWDSDLPVRDRTQTGQVGKSKLELEDESWTWIDTAIFVTMMLIGLIAIWGVISR